MIFSSSPCSSSLLIADGLVVFVDSI